MQDQSPEVIPTSEHVATLERLGDEIAELSAHLDAATARLLDLIREFDAREGWGNGFRSCADWLSWRVGLDKGARASGSAWRAPSARCRASPKLSPAERSRTPRCAP
jgi:hypothetical protein